MNLLLLVVAVVCFILATLFLFGVASVTHPMGWLALGLACFAGSFLVAGAVPLIRDRT